MRGTRSPARSRTGKTRPCVTFSGALANYGSKSVTESTVAGWSLTSVNCQGATNTGSGGTATVVVNPGDHVVCTFTNKKDARLTIRKVTDPANSGADTFPFASVELGPFTLDTNGLENTYSNEKV